MDLKDVRFHNPRLARVGVEVLAFDQLRARAGHLLGAPERVDFHLLLLVQAGRSTHMVDFVDQPLRAGVALLIRPGQVHQWRMTPALQGFVLLIAAEALAPSIARAQLDMKLLALDDWPAASRPSRTLFAEALADVRRLAADIAAFDGSELASALVRHELLALLLRLARERGTQAGSQVRSREAEIHRLFARALEGRFDQRTTVREHARRLGYSESTLNRACLSSVGQTAKQVVDERIALEAKRLLVHSDATVVAIAHRLGFSEPTNFVKFFRRMAGGTPAAFRAGTMQPAS